MWSDRAPAFPPRVSWVRCGPGEAPARPLKESCRMQMADQVELRSVESLSLSAHVVARIVVAQLSGKPPKGT